MQTTSKILMVRPFRFAFNEETAGNNHFQQKTDQSLVHEKAVEEFDAFVKLLRGNDVDVTVVQDTPEPWTPDSIFPNNWFSSHIMGELVLYPMFAENRRQERKPEVLHLLRRRMNHPKLIDLTHWEKENQFLEGTGSMIFDRDKRIAYACRSQRTSEKVLVDFCSRMNFDYILFDAVDKNGNPIYHTNVMMEIGTPWQGQSPIRCWPTVLLWCRCIDRERCEPPQAAMHFPVDHSTLRTLRTNQIRHRRAVRLAMGLLSSPAPRLAR